MFKNAASQSVALFAFDTTTGAPKTGDAANMLFYITKDWGSVTAVAGNSGVPTEMDATNAKGWYKIAVSQTESNADAILFSGKSSTSNISVVGVLVQTVPANFTTLSIDGSGRVDIAKIAGTAQTARDIGASVLLAAGQKVDVDTIKTNPVVNAGTVTFPTTATLASTTNITAGTITTATSVTNRVTANTDQINGNATAASQVALANASIGRGTCAGAGTTTSITTSAFTPGGAGIVSGQFIGRTVVFDYNTTTVALQGQATNITANTSGAAPTFTVTALTTAPSSGDTFGVY